MIKQEDISDFADELKNWLASLLNTETPIASSKLINLTKDVSEKLNLRKTLAIRVFSRRVLGIIYPEHESFLLGNIPDSIEMDLRSEPEISLADASSILLQELCGSIKSFDKCDLIKHSAANVLELNASPIPRPNMPFNDDDPYMKVLD